MFRKQLKKSHSSALQRILVRRFNSLEITILFYNENSTTTFLAILKRCDILVRAWCASQRFSYCNSCSDPFFGKMYFRPNQWVSVGISCWRKSKLIPCRRNTFAINCNQQSMISEPSRNASMGIRKNGKATGKVCWVVFQAYKVM